MSQEFLTISEAAVKLKESAFGSDFITKVEAIGLGAEPDLLMFYSEQEYPVDDDIILGMGELNISVMINLSNHQIDSMECMDTYAEIEIL